MWLKSDIVSIVAGTCAADGFEHYGKLMYEPRLASISAPTMDKEAVDTALFERVLFRRG